MVSLPVIIPSDTLLPHHTLLVAFGREHCFFAIDNAATAVLSTFSLFVFFLYICST